MTRVVITHLTRMQPGYVCIAGIDPATGEHIRPVVSGRRILREEIAFDGNEISVGTELDLGETAPAPTPPEVEDHTFDPLRARRVRDWSAAELREFLRAYAVGSLREIFGPDLEADGATASLAVGVGRASLGCLAPSVLPTLMVDGYNKVKLSLFDEGRQLSVTVADLGLYERDQRTPDLPRVRAAQSAIAAGAELFLSVGLSRPWAKGGGPRRHWLQINNVIPAGAVRRS
jgi:hypothetical protein